MMLDHLPLAVKNTLFCLVLQILQEEVSRQQIILNQTSQALSLIASNESLRNTVEEIEAEKMMVISSKYWT